MQRLDDLSVLQHFFHLFRRHDVHMNIFGGFLMLLPPFLYACSEERVRAVVMVRRIGRKGLG